VHATVFIRSSPTAHLLTTLENYLKTYLFSLVILEHGTAAY